MPTLDDIIRDFKLLVTVSCIRVRSSFLIKDEAALDHICRYVEMNPVRAKLVDNPEDKQWTGGQSSD